MTESLCDEILHCFLMVGEYVLAPIFLLIITYFTKGITDEHSNSESIQSQLEPSLEYLLLGIVGIGALALRSFSAHLQVYFCLFLTILFVAGILLVFRYINLFKSYWIGESKFRRFLWPNRMALWYQFFLVVNIYIYIILEEKVHFYIATFVYSVVILIVFIFIFIFYSYSRRLPGSWNYYHLNAIHYLNIGKIDKANSAIDRAIISSNSYDKLYDTSLLIDQILQDPKEKIRFQTIILLKIKKFSYGQNLSIKEKVTRYCSSQRIDKFNDELEINFSINQLKTFENVKYYLSHSLRLIALFFLIILFKIAYR